MAKLILVNIRFVELTVACNLGKPHSWSWSFEVSYSQGRGPGHIAICDCATVTWLESGSYSWLTTVSPFPYWLQKEMKKRSFITREEQVLASLFLCFCSITCCLVNAPSNVSPSLDSIHVHTYQAHVHSIVPAFQLVMDDLHIWKISQKLEKEKNVMV